MLPALFLVLLSLCNAQWPLQSVGHEEVKSFPMSPDQPGYPYDDLKRVENIPNPNFARILVEDPPKRPIIVHGRNLLLPEMDKGKEKDVDHLDTSDSSSSESSESEESKEDLQIEFASQKPPLDTKFPVPSDLSKIIGNVTLSKISSVKNRVANLVNEGNALRNDTDQLVDQLNLLYLNLAIDESDNEVREENSYKYGMSVILRFLFEFYRIFRKLSSQTTQTQLRLTNVDVYGLSYDKAVVVLKEKKGYSPLELSAPIRRAFDVFKSILYQSVIIIQTKCSTMDPNWKCIIMFLANLISETFKCSNVWYHAFIHMLALEKIGLHDSFVYKIANLDKFKELTYFENIFDFILEKIQEYREVGRVQLSAEAIFFTMLADLQENGLLDCVNIDYLFN